MRPAGGLAAAALYALDEHVARLADDHLRAQQFRDALAGGFAIDFPMANPTNIVFMDVADAASFVARLREHDVLMLAAGPTRVRAVFHLDIDDAGLERAIAACKDAV